MQKCLINSVMFLQDPVDASPLRCASNIKIKNNVVINHTHRQMQEDMPHIGILTEGNEWTQQPINCHQTI